MKKRTILWVILAILLLIVLDQGAKLAVDHFYVEPEGILQVNHTVHIHRIFNDSDALEAAAHAEETGRSPGFWMAVHILDLAVGIVLVFAVIFFIDRFFLWDIDAKRYPKLTGAWFSLTLSAMLCHFIDDIFRGGCPDFLCIPRDYKEPVGDHFHDAILHRAYDLKDLFLFLGTVLFFILVILWLIEFIKYDKRDEKHLIAKFKHPIRNIKASFKKGKEQTL